MDDVDEVVGRLVALHGDDGVVAPTATQWRTILQEDDGGPVRVVYLVQFAGSDGAESFFAAGAQIVPVIEDVGGRPLFGSWLRHVLVAPFPADEQWDYVGAAEYPSIEAFIRLWLDDRFVAAGELRRAGTARHRLLVTEPLQWES